ncbi:MAG: LacI family DNA-binding transcriptional regulator [Muricoprocola sp.]
MTLKEIAAQAGVSVATVSYVLNGTAKVSDETRKRVEKIIKETGYKANILARGLRTNKSSLVGVMIEDITVSHTAFIIDGINEIAEKRGYQTVLGNLRLLSKIDAEFEHITEYQDDIDREVALLLAMQVDGIIYVGMHDRYITDVLHDLSKPVVYCYCYTSYEGSSVTYGNEKAAYQITQMFLQKGHRDFVVIKGKETSEATSHRMHGIERALKEYEVELKRENIIVGNWKYKETVEAIEPIFERKVLPTAFIAMNDEMAVAVMDVAKKHGLSIPEDISVSGFDNADIVHYSTPRLTTVDRPLQQMGYRALEMLIDKIEKGEEGEMNLILPCKIIEGTSIREI